MVLPGDRGQGGEEGGEAGGCKPLHFALELKIEVFGNENATEGAVCARVVTCEEERARENVIVGGEEWHVTAPLPLSLRAKERVVVLQRVP
mmetsp:Transcript_37258/g.87951  ORF Transcript_37258/g.87951 Transcript_37258/m.87951 type:complete len:91 (+) Transcript_37258:134-406(+)